MDWGDGTINRETTHTYKYDPNKETTMLRVKGDIKKADETRSVFNENTAFVLIQIGKYVTSCAGMFEGCKKILSVAQNAFLQAVQLTDCSNMFKGCGHLMFVNDSMHGRKSKVTTIDGMFSGCKELEWIQDDQFNNMKHLVSASSVFLDCSNLVHGAGELFDGCTNLVDVSGLFENCVKLWLPIRGMFKGCAKLENIDSMFSIDDALEETSESMIDRIPETLFWDCRKLRTANKAFYNRRHLR